MIPGTGARRPAPSKAALRVLYQLAYVTSGTVVGVATLCAEERRRQTRLFQTIADNARLLRSSPRYVGYSTAAGLAEQRWEDGDVHDMHEKVGEETTGHRRAGRQRHPRPLGHDERPAVDADLPSQVASGYEHLAAMRGCAGAEGQGQELAVAAEEKRACEDDKLSSPDADSSGGAAASRAEASMFDGASHTAFRPNTLHLSWKPASRQPKVFERLKRGQERNAPSDSTVDKAAMFKDEVERFFRSPNTVPRCTEAQALAADQLLHVALEEGYFLEARSLLLWRLGTGTKSTKWPTSLCTLLCGHLREMKMRPTDYHLRKVLRETFESGLVQRLPKYLQLKLGVHMVDWTILRFGEQSRAELDDVFLHHLWSMAGAEESLADVERLLKSLLKDRSFDLALRLVDAWFSYGQTLPHTSLNEMFHSAFSVMRLAVCAQVLKRRNRSGVYDDMLVEQHQKFILACGRKGSLYMLSSLFDSLCRDAELSAWLVPRLETSAQAVLVHACAQVEDFAYVADAALLPNLPRSLVTDLLSHHCAAQIKRKWKTTHDLRAVEQTFIVECRRAEEAALGADEMQRIEVAVVEVISSAGQTDRALKMLATIGRTYDNNAHTLAVSLVVLARQRAWEQFGKLMELIELGQFHFSADPLAATSLHDALHEFSLYHDAAEITTLAKRMTGPLQLPISRLTTDIVLQSYVRLQRPERISSWLRYAASLGESPVLEISSVANLLSHYYQEHHPPHTFFLALCRQFLVRSGMQDHKPFLDLAMESIGRDLRKPPSNHGNMPDMRRLMRLNMQRLEEGSGEFPPPLLLEHLRTMTPDDLAAAVDAMQTDDMNRSGPGRPTRPQIRRHSLDPFRDDSERTVLVRAMHTWSRPRSLERKMLLALSVEDHQAVLDMYHESLSATGLPPSPRVLEIAVEAALARDPGTTDGALQLMSKARFAGMNVTCASGPLLIQEINNYSSSDKRDASKLLGKVIDYYRSNEMNGWQVRHHVGVHAAHVLLTAHAPKDALALLNTVYQSKWALDRPLDIVAMTVYLRAYAALDDLAGVRWVVETVLRERIRIDAAFLNAVHNVSAHVASRARTADEPGAEDAWRLLRASRTLCSEERMRQKKESGSFGWKLVQRLLECIEGAVQPSEATMMVRRPGLRVRFRRIGGQAPAPYTRPDLHVRRLRKTTISQPGRSASSERSASGPPTPSMLLDDLAARAEQPPLSEPWAKGDASPIFQYMGSEDWQSPWLGETVAVAA